MSHFMSNWVPDDERNTESYLSWHNSHYSTKKSADVEGLHLMGTLWIVRWTQDESHGHCIWISLTIGTRGWTAIWQDCNRRQNLGVSSTSPPSKKSRVQYGRAWKTNSKKLWNSQEKWCSQSSGMQSAYLPWVPTTSFNHHCWLVHDQNLQCVSPDGHFLNILFTEMDESRKAFPNANYRKDIFPNRFFKIFFMFLNPLYTIRKHDE